MANESISKLRKIQAEAQAVLEHEWVPEHEEAKLSPGQKFARFWVFVGRSFARNRCPVRASSLAYTTLLALVPLLAVALSISTALLKGEEGKGQIKEFVNTALGKIAPQLGLKADGTEAKLDQVTDFIHSSIENVQSGTLGVTAVVLLIFIAISLLSTIEATMNDIWGVTRGRSWISRIVQYWAVITLGPVLLLVAMGLNASPRFEATREFLFKMPGFVLVLYQDLLPLIILCAAFAVFYKLMPSTKVEWRAAVVGGICGGLLLHLNNVFSMIYFGRVVRDSKIYGSLGSLPIFLVGLYFSWVILLFGAQIAYAYQNRRAYAQEKQAENINERGREFLAMRVMTYIGYKFFIGDRPPTALQIGEDLGVPMRVINKVAEPLVQTKLLVEVTTPEKGDVAFSPARPLDKISYQNILDSVRTGLGQQIPTREDDVRAVVNREFDRIQEAERTVAATITLDKLAREFTVNTRREIAIQNKS